MRIPVPDTQSFLAKLNTQWAGGLLPTAYPASNGFVTASDDLRLMPFDSGPGTQASDPRAMGGYGNANYKIVPSRDDLFSQNTLVGGSSVVTGVNSSFLIKIALGALVLFAVLKFVKR